MAVKTLLIDEAELIDFQLYGLISSFSDSPQFIYHLNLHFETQFQRMKDLDVLIEKQMTYYPIFEWENYVNGTCYHIIKNIAYTLEKSQNLTNLSALFEVAPALIPQYREYNFLLKITGENEDEIPINENSFIQKITWLDTSKIKTVNQLIF